MSLRSRLTARLAARVKRSRELRRVRDREAAEASAARKAWVKARNLARKTRKRLGGLEPQVWHPEATRVPHAGAGPFTVGRPKLVWHTTEGYGLPTYSGSAPHFTLHPGTGKLYQHIAINESARALAHPYGPETNRARAIQVELIGFAHQTQDWPASHYENIARLARWIEQNAGVPRRCTVEFRRGVPRLSGQAFVDYTGHIGHCHVPGNDHWDPGDFRIKDVL